MRKVERETERVSGERNGEWLTSNSEMKKKRKKKDRLLNGREGEGERAGHRILMCLRASEAHLSAPAGKKAFVPYLIHPALF